jgi:hypothetical protein
MVTDKRTMNLSHDFFFFLATRNGNFDVPELSIGNPLSEELCSMFLPASASENRSLEQTVINTPKIQSVALAPVHRDGRSNRRRASPAHAPDGIHERGKRGGGAPVGRLPSACGTSVRLPNQLQPELNLA